MFIDNAKGLSAQGIKVENNQVSESINHNLSDNNNININKNIDINNSNPNNSNNDITINKSKNNYDTNSTSNNSGKNYDASQLLVEDTDLNFLLKDADIKFDDPIEVGVVTDKNNNNRSVNANNINSNFNINANNTTNKFTINANNINDLGAGSAANNSLSKPEDNPIFIEDEDIESLFNDNFY